MGVIDSLHHEPLDNSMRVARCKALLQDEWAPMIRSVFARRNGTEIDMEVSLDDDENLSITFDEFQVFAPEQIDGKPDRIILWLWTQSHGGYFEPPDCNESELGVFDTINDALRAAWMHRAEDAFNTAMENFGEWQLDQKTNDAWRKTDEIELARSLTSAMEGTTDWEAVAKTEIEKHGLVTHEDIRKINEPYKDVILDALKKD